MIDILPYDLINIIWLRIINIKKLQEKQNYYI